MRSLTYIASLALAGSALAAPFVPSFERRNTDPVSDGPVIEFEMNYEHGLYSIPLAVGTPPKTFKVLFDTGSELSWIPSVECDTANCLQSERYNASESSTSYNEFKKVIEKYEDGRRVIGKKYKETVTLGGTPAPNPPLFRSYPITAAKSVKGFDASDYLGFFGFGSAEALYSIYTALEELPDDYNGGLKKRNQGSTPWSSGPGGFGSGKRKRWNEKTAKLSLGIDPSRYEGQIYYFDLPVSEKECENKSIYWRTPLKRVSLDGKHSCNLLPKSYAKFATGTRYIKAPPVHADFLHLKFGALYNVFHHRYEFKCTEQPNVPDLILTFEDYQINIPASLWTAPVDPKDTSDKAKCYSMVRRGNEKFKEWTIGTLVLDQFYQIWDYSNKQMGLAHLPEDASQANITTILHTA
ncbi:aspartic peptidase domain-containing protein [Fennellomyces sp. T-0311]|nr:aspartic peptidase domain-containing protein [Fennellomyces sp. T-0311]